MQNVNGDPREVGRVARAQRTVNQVDQVTICGNPGQLKSFFDGLFELSAHLVVANLVKKKGAILVNLPREKHDLIPGPGSI